MHDSNRNTLGHQNSYSSQDIRSQNMQQRQQDMDKFAKELIKKPEVVTQMIPLVNLQKELLLTIYLACV